jgi:enoyl-CoA hydratase/carnithine racemase
LTFVKYERQGSIVIVTMNRPEQLNAMNLDMIDELSQAWIKLEDDPEARVAILTGTGKAYCVGFDMKQMDEGKLHPTTLQTMIPLSFSPRSQSKPVIAAVNGHAIGAGFDFMAMDADMIVAAESATFGMPEVIYGMASLGSPFAWANVPRCIAMEIVLTGESITAERAHETGFVNRVVPDDELMDTAMRIAERIVANSPAAVRQSRRNLLRSTQSSEASRIEETYAAARPDMCEATARGIAAFVRKERPVWS